MPVRILLADDHEVVRQGLRTILQARPEWEIIGEADNGQRAIEAVKELRPDIVILDITMPIMSGLEATQAIAAAGVPTRVLIFTMHDSKSLVKAVRKAGAAGYVLKSRAARDLIRAIEALLGGGMFFGPDLATESPEKGEVKGFNLMFRSRLSCFSFIAL
ncbi:MAG TPA: response regulator transcription factor [Terriglobales bacterium]|nr:response regulator transcription factor [Terriglobales bacterium]